MPVREIARRYIDGAWRTREVDEASGGGSLPSGGTTGDVLTKASNADGDADWEAPSGGSGPLEAINIPIAFDTPGLATGLSTGITVVEGDVVIYAAVSVTVAWNGSAPACGLYVPGFDPYSGGAFAGGTIDSTNNDVATGVDAPAVGGSGTGGIVSAAGEIKFKTYNNNTGDPDDSTAGAGAISLVVLHA